MKISKTFEISLGHRLSDYSGKCRHLHGHNYIGKLTIIGSRLNNLGMLMDYGDLKNIIQSTIDARFDHKFVLKQHDPFNEALGKVCNEYNDDSIVWVNYNPTVENLIEDMKSMVKEVLENTVINGHMLGVELDLSETSTSYAYTE